MSATADPTGSAPERPRPRPAGRRAAVLGALLLAATLAGCGIPLDARPTGLPTGRLPSALQPAADSSSNQPPAPTQHGCASHCVTVYFVDTGGNLVPVTRHLKSRRTLQLALQQLANGPTNQEEYQAGYTTWLPFPPAPLLTVSNPSAAGIVYVTLDSATSLLFNYEYWEALGQIVYTLDDPAEFPAVRGVKFIYSGSDYAAQTPNGTYTNKPVDRQDYASIAQPA